VILSEQNSLAGAHANSRLRPDVPLRSFRPDWAAVLSPALGKKLVAALGLEQGPELDEALGMVLGERTRRGARFTTGIGARGDAGSSARLCTRASIRAGAGRSAGVALCSSLGDAL
jgi:hypothetical protein